jgi:hypothetical protein
MTVPDHRAVTRRPGRPACRTTSTPFQVAATRTGRKFQISSVTAKALTSIKASAGYPRAPQTHLVFCFWRNCHHGSRDRSASRWNSPASSLSDVSRRLPDAGFLSAVLGMDSLEVRGQPHLRVFFIFRAERCGLRLRHFSHAPDIFSRSFGQTATVSR